MKLYAVRFIASSIRREVIRLERRVLSLARSNNRRIWRTLLTIALLCDPHSSVAQTGVAGAYEHYVFAKGLDRPEAVAPLNDHEVLVAERSGRILDLDGITRTDLGPIEVKDLHIFYVPDRPYTEGLKDLISVPNHPREFLWCMTTGNAEEVRWTVGRARIAVRSGRPKAMSSEIVWQTDPQAWTRESFPPFSGCRLAVDGGDVVVAMGANSRSTGSGRIMRISLSGEHPPKVISTGHRNPSGVLFRSGVLWEVEHGPKGGDELNIIVAGGDYGWPTVSEGEPDDGLHQGFITSRVGFIDPVVTWTPAIAPSSLTAWRGKLYVGALRGAAVIEITLDGKRVISQTRFLDLGTRICDVRAAEKNNFLWVLTDGPDAKLIRIRPT